MKNHIHKLLLAEDNIDEYFTFIAAINKLSTRIDVMRVDDGYTLLNMLQTYINVDAIFLDINMKYKNGLLALREIRDADTLKNVPIIILSQSDYELNVKLAYDLGATFFVKKTNCPRKLSSLLESVFESPYFLSGTQPTRDLFYMNDPTSCSPTN